MIVEYIGNPTEVSIAKAYSKYYRSGLHWGDTFKKQPKKSISIEQVDEIPDGDE